MPRVRILGLCAVLLALTVVAYLPVWNNDYIDADDLIYIPTNPHVTKGFTWEGFLWAWSVERIPYPAPLTWWSFQLDAQCFGRTTPEGEAILPPAAVHGQNLFWHAIDVLLVFGFWQWVGGRPGRSFLIAALFAIHPMHVESVAWAAERKDVLSVFFGLLALFAYVHYVHQPSWRRYAVVVAAWWLSLLAKPMLLTLPLMLLMLDYWPLRRVRNSSAGEAKAKGRSWNHLILEKFPLFLLVAVWGTVTLRGGEIYCANVSLDNLSIPARLVNALAGYGWYFYTTFYPVRLAALYPHRYENWQLLPAVVGGAILLSVTLLCFWQARRRPWLIVGWLWFVVTLLPVIGLAQQGRQAWADRFSYWPHIGLFAAIVWQLAELAERLRVPGLVSRLVAALVVGWLTVLTYHQVGYWRDTGTLWEHAAAVTTDNDQAHEHLSVYYHKHGRREEGQAHLREAARIQQRRNQQRAARE
jgi:hypothetical protein